MATAHGQLHMTGNCITLSSFCELQEGGRIGRTIGGAAAAKFHPLSPPPPTVHPIPHPWQRERGGECKRDRTTSGFWCALRCSPFSVLFFFFIILNNCSTSFLKLLLQLRSSQLAVVVVFALQMANTSMLLPSTPHPHHHLLSSSFSSSPGTTAFASCCLHPLARTGGALSL